MRQTTPSPAWLMRAPWSAKRQRAMAIARRARGDYRRAEEFYGIDFELHFRHLVIGVPTALIPGRTRRAKRVGVFLPVAPPHAHCCHVPAVTPAAAFLCAIAPVMRELAEGVRAKPPAAAKRMTGRRLGRLTPKLFARNPLCARASTAASP